MRILGLEVHFGRLLYALRWIQSLAWPVETTVHRPGEDPIALLVQLLRGDTPKAPAEL
jgi:hypothetical protein